MRRALALCVALTLVAACGGDDDTDTAATTTAPDRTTTTASGPAVERATSTVACEELVGLMEDASNGEVYDIEWPGRLEEVQRVAEVDGDAWLYAELEDAIDEFDPRDAEAGVERVGQVMMGCAALLAQQ